MSRPFEIISIDLLLNKLAYPHLNAQDIGRLMQCSKDFYSFFVLDEAWNGLKARCVEAIPFWKPLGNFSLLFLLAFF